MAIPVVSTTGFKTFVKPSANFHSAADRFSQLSFVIISDDTDFFNANNLSTIAKSLSHLVEQDIMESYSYRCFFFAEGHVFLSLPFQCDGSGRLFYGILVAYHLFHLIY